MANNESIKYFIFSKEQLDYRTNTEKRLGKTFKPGTVIVQGVPKMFTEMSDKPTNRFSDGRIVHQGVPSAITFTEPIAE